MLDLETRQARRVWQSKAPFYEQPGSIMNDLDPVRPLSWGPALHIWGRALRLGLATTLHEMGSASFFNRDAQAPQQAEWG